MKKSKTPIQAPGAPLSDEAFVARLRDVWGEPELSASERVSFVERTEARLAAPRRGREWMAWPWGVGLAAGLAGAAVLALWVGGLEPRRQGIGQDGVVAAGQVAQSTSPGTGESSTTTNDLVGLLVDAEQGATATSNDGAGSASANLWRVQADGGLGEHLPAEYRALAMWVAVPEHSLGDE